MINHSSARALLLAVATCVLPACAARDAAESRILAEVHRLGGSSGRPSPQTRLFATP
jgi:hypothetical protein